MAIKRISDERALLAERRDREREREESAESAYDASTDGEAEMHGEMEPEQQASDASSDEADAQSDGHMTDDDVSALPEAASGGVDCDQSGDQQGHVLSFGHDPNLICQSEGCDRCRRRYFERGYVSPSLRAGVLLPHCYRDCVRNNHCSSCREVGPQPKQDFYGRAFVPEMSLATQRLITPPEQMQTTLVPQLEQEETIGEQSFADQAAVRTPSQNDDSVDVFINDGDDDEPSPAPEAGRLDQREGQTVSATGWCNGGAVRLDRSMAIVTADALGQMPHGGWQSCVGDWLWRGSALNQVIGIGSGRVRARDSVRCDTEATNRVDFLPGELTDIAMDEAPLLIGTAEITKEGLYSLDSVEYSMLVDVARDSGSSGEEPDEAR